MSQFEFQRAVRHKLPMGVLETAQSVGELMRAIPGPTDEWADLVGNVAWPGVVVFLVTRYRTFLRKFLDTIATRIRTDHVRIGMFEMTPNSEVIALDPETVGDSTDHYEPADIERIERLFEFIAQPDGFRKMTTWMNEQVSETLEIADFLTAPEYATQRETAHKTLIEEGEQ